VTAQPNAFVEFHAIASQRQREQPNIQIKAFSNLDKVLMMSLILGNLS
jgi:hypothetical protein